MKCSYAYIFNVKIEEEEKKICPNAMKFTLLFVIIKERLNFKFGENL